MSPQIAEPRSTTRTLRVFSAAGVLAAAVVAVNVNLLVARYYQRWDFTSNRLYTPSRATEQTLASLDQPVDVVVLLGRGDPLLASVRHLLESYGALTRSLRVKFLDPEQNPAEFSAIQNRYGILTGKAEDGRLLTDASIVITQKNRHWFITSEDLMAFDAESGNVRPRLEQALTGGIVNVQDAKKVKVCFTKGHSELGLHDAGPEGLTELRERIQKSNYETEERELPGSSRAPLAGCGVVIVAGPKLAFGENDAVALASAVRAGTDALLLVGPLVSESGTMQSSGLGPVALLADAELGQNLVIETAGEARLPRSVGEMFFASPRPHAVTQGLLKGETKVELRVLVSGATSVRPLSPKSVPILASSDQAVLLTDVRPLADGRLPEVLSQAKPASVVLGVARELDANGTNEKTRLVVIGSGSVAQNRSFRDSALYGDRMLVENAVSWLAARPALVSVPEKPLHEIGLALTEDSLSEVMRYVIVYMPGSAALLGAALLFRRRATEKQSRNRANPKKDDDEARA